MTSILNTDNEEFKSKVESIDSISLLTSIIINIWNESSKRGVNYACKPYLEAMLHDDYGYDSKKSVVLYCLSNMSSFRGDKAKILKNRLKQMVLKL